MSLDNLIFDIGQKRYINLTNKCALRCDYCPKLQGDWNVNGTNLRLRCAPSYGDYLEALDDLEDIFEVIFSGYGEPTLRLDVLLPLARYCKNKGVKVKLITDGLSNARLDRNLLEDLRGLVDSIEISMNADTAEAYQVHCRPKIDNAYNEVLEFIELAPKYINEVIVTAVDGLDDVNLDTCRQIAHQFGADFHPRALHANIM
ncbi:MAG: radical SAM protein [Kangiellaceae bacterium]|jgi:TatD family-associated radical SAM protein|nr:radical SAM protein [Kangiellaceae bacterium]|tara:strand:+ start:2768 stop:3373 length:606 start_codon:yes stop_codon:yes gene_type:complete